jgi:GNAT superfamily N-acetyltransferase
VEIRIRQAGAADAAAIEGMLLEAARWVDALGVVMWEEGELDSVRIARETGAGQFFLAEVGAAAAGAIRFQLTDEQFWPDLAPSDLAESAFVHRLVVRRTFKGQGVSEALLAWAVTHARALGKRFLRLDCDADRVKLRALYERCGFRFHSYRRVGAYYVARYELPIEDATGLSVR